VTNLKNPQLKSIIISTSRNTRSSLKRRNVAKGVTPSSPDSLQEMQMRMMKMHCKISEGLRRFRLMQAAFEDEENEDAVGEAFDDSEEVAIVEEGGDGLIKKHLKQLNKGSITDKEFYKAMQKLKDRGTNAVPPKKSASAYIIFGKEVS
jgi:hypothetical protein